MLRGNIIAVCLVAVAFYVGVCSALDAQQHREEGIQRAQAGDLAGAVQAFRAQLEASATDTERAAALSNLGTALMRQQRWVEAIDSLRAAKELDETQRLARDNLDELVAYLQELHGPTWEAVIRNEEQRGGAGDGGAPRTSRFSSSGGGRNGQPRSGIDGETPVDFWEGVVQRLQDAGHDVLSLSDDPALDARVVHGFLSDDEVQELIDLHDTRIEAVNTTQWCFAPERFDVLERAGLPLPDDANDYHCVDDADASARFFDPDFGIAQTVSTSVVIPSGAHAVTDRLERRMALELGLPPGHAWDNQLLRYHEGQAYREHTDCIPGTAVAGGRDRSVTTLIYLSDVEEGGETVFPKVNVRVAPRKGTLLLWNSLDATASCLESSTHAARRVLRGTKYAFQKWYDFVPAELEPPVEAHNSVGCDPADCRHYVYDASLTRANGQLRAVVRGGGRVDPEEAVLAALDVLRAHPHHRVAASMLGYHLVEALDFASGDDALRRAAELVPPAIAALDAIVAHYDDLDEDTGMPERPGMADVAQYATTVLRMCRARRIDATTGAIGARQPPPPRQQEDKKEEKEEEKEDESGRVSVEVGGDATVTAAPADNKRSDAAAGGIDGDSGRAGAAAAGDVPGVPADYSSQDPSFDHAAVGLALDAAGHSDAAVAAFDAALLAAYATARSSASPDDADLSAAVGDLGVALMRAGLFGGARVLLEDALRRDGGNGVAKRSLSELEAFLAGDGAGDGAAEPPAAVDAQATDEEKLLRWTRAWWPAGDAVASDPLRRAAEALLEALSGSMDCARVRAPARAFAAAFDDGEGDLRDAVTTSTVDGEGDWRKLRGAVELLRGVCA